MSNHRYRCIVSYHCSWDDGELHEVEFIVKKQTEKAAQKALKDYTGGRTKDKFKSVEWKNKVTVGKAAQGYLYREEEVIFSHSWIENDRVCRSLEVTLRKGKKTQSLAVWERASEIFSSVRIPVDFKIPDFDDMPHHVVTSLFEHEGGCMAAHIADFLKAPISFEERGEWGREGGPVNGTRIGIRD